MTENNKKIIEETIQKILDTKNISKTQKMEIFINQTKELEQELTKFAPRISDIKQEIRLLKKYINKLSTRGWQKFQN